MKTHLTILLLLAISICLGTQANEHFVLNETNESASVLSFQLDELTFDQSGEFTSIKADNSGYTREIGLPELPHFTTLFQIDPAKNYTVDFTITQSHIVSDISIAPKQPDDQDNGSNTLDINTEFYQSENTYPLNNLSVSEPQIMRGIELISIKFIPFQYQPATNELVVYDQVDFTITETGHRENPETRSMPRSRTFEQLYESLLINFDADPRTEDFQTPCVLYICGGNALTNPYMQLLIDWRHRRGYEVIAVSTSETGTTTTSIKNYIQNVYDTNPNPPEFVGLVGDVGGSYGIPTYYEGWSGYGGEGDHPYSQLAGGDLLPEVLIGRISIESSTDLSVIVNKVINYEKATYTSSDWFERAALVGDPSYSGLSTIICNEYIQDMMEIHGMDDVRANLGSGNYEYWMESELENGILYFNYRGYLGNSGFGSDNISDANNGYMTPFVTFLTCGTGSFGGTAISETFLRAGSLSNPKGGVAAIGTATLGTHTCMNNIVDMGFYDGIFARGLETGGAALAAGKLALYNTYPDDPDDKVSIFTRWNNLMGDPALHLWTGTPVNISAEYPEIIGSGSNYIDIIVTDEFDNPVESAIVTASNASGSIFISKYTDDDGLATIQLNPSISGSVDLVITKRDHKPIEGTFTISATGPCVNLVEHGIAIIDDDNSDGVLNPGETITFEVTVKNYGSETAHNVSAILETTSELVTINISNINLGDIVPTESIPATFELTLDPAAIYQEELDLHIFITDDAGNNWSSIILIDVNAPKLEVIDYQVVDDDIINPGETAELSITLANTGVMAASAVFAQLSTASNLIEFVDDSLEWLYVSPQMTSESFDTFMITANGDIINGTILPFALHLTNENGYDRTEYVNIQFGEVTVSDPLGPDNHGYYIYDSNDITYNLAPSYDWIEIDPDYGGPGTSLNMNDSGNGNPQSQQSAHVTLPFTFTFYGVDYNEITVSTNGWIALGDSESESFRNYQVPGPGGPSPMIAAFWDDLETSSGGQVYKYLNSSEGYVVIEWSEMRSNDQNDVETFEIILYDSFTPSGDDEIKIQYKEFNNTSIGNIHYGGITHGMHCTTGIENHFGNDGLQYTYDDQYPAAAMTLADETALFITTNIPEILPSPALAFSPEFFEFELGFDDLISSNLTIANNGEDGSVLYYSLEKSPFQAYGAPDEFGHYWSDSDLDDTIEFEWIDIEGMGTPLTFPHNDQAADRIAIGFDFPFYGEVYDSCIINANGWIGFGEDNTEWDNGSLPDPNAPRPAIFPWWDDLNPVNEGDSPSMEGDVFVYSTADMMVIWWDHVAHWSGEIDGNYNFQTVLFANGEIHFNYDELEGTINRATIGIQNADGTDGIEIIEDNTYIHEFMSVQIKGSPYWLEFNEVSDGELDADESLAINVTLDSQGLTAGDYSAYISLNTNVQPRILIPVDLTVSDIEWHLGDLDQDLEVNIQDIVMLISFIAGGIDPTEYQLWAGDINGDLILNVLDVVALVNIIMEL